MSLVPVLKSEFLVPERELPGNLVEYDWQFLAKEEIDKGDKDRGRAACPYSVSRENEHRESCVCFRGNLGKVLG